jgi:hypothetical protein
VHKNSLLDFYKTQILSHTNKDREAADIVLNCEERRLIKFTKIYGNITRQYWSATLSTPMCELFISFPYIPYARAVNQREAKAKEDTILLLCNVLATSSTAVHTAQCTRSFIHSSKLTTTTTTHFPLNY